MQHRSVCQLPAQYTRTAIDCAACCCFHPAAGSACCSLTSSCRCCWCYATQVKEALDSIAAMSDLAATQLQLPLGSAAVVTNGRTVIDYNPAAGNATLAPGMCDRTCMQLHQNALKAVICVTPCFCQSSPAEQTHNGASWLYACLVCTHSTQLQHATSCTPPHPLHLLLLFAPPSLLS
jgi:hypothetical protein